MLLEVSVCSCEKRWYSSPGFITYLPCDVSASPGGPHESVALVQARASLQTTGSLIKPRHFSGHQWSWLSAFPQTCASWVNYEKPLFVHKACLVYLPKKKPKNHHRTFTLAYMEKVEIINQRQTGHKCDHSSNWQNTLRFWKTINTNATPHVLDNCHHSCWRTRLQMI